MEHNTEIVPDDDENDETEVVFPEKNLENASLSELKSILLQALQVVEILEKRENEAKGAPQRAEKYATTPRKPSREEIPEKIERRSSKNELPPKRYSADKYSNQEDPVQRQRGSSKDERIGRENRYEPKPEPALKRERNYSKEERNSREERYTRENKYSNKYDRISPKEDNYTRKRELPKQEPKKSYDTSKYSDDLTELKSSSIDSKRSSGSSLQSGFSGSDTDGKNLKERMHQMSIILRNLELQLDELHPQN